MRMTVESALEKMHQLMLQLREGEKPHGRPAGVELRPIVQRIAAVAEQRGRRLEISQLEPVATRGHAERMERVLGHIVQNAFDATPPDRRVWLALRRHSGQAHVVVGDEGEGMSREFVEQRLFKPFSSTKATSAPLHPERSTLHPGRSEGSVPPPSWAAEQVPRCARDEVPSVSVRL
jgi:signal transduction histidine kinase